MKFFTPDYGDYKRYKDLNQGRGVHTSDTITGARKLGRLSKDDPNAERFSAKSKETGLNPTEIKFVESILGHNLTDADFDEEGILSGKGITNKLKSFKARRALAQYLLMTSNLHSGLEETDATTLAAIAGINPDMLEDYMGGMNINSDKEEYRRILKKLLDDVPDELYKQVDADVAKGRAEQDALDKAIDDGVVTEEETYPVNRAADAQHYWQYELHPYENKPLITDEERTALGNIAKTITANDLGRKL